MAENFIAAIPILLVPGPFLPLLAGAGGEGGARLLAPPLYAALYLSGGDCSFMLKRATSEMCAATHQRQEKGSMTPSPIGVEAGASP